jgi:hypothetical protein
MSAPVLADFMNPDHLNASLVIIHAKPVAVLIRINVSSAPLNHQVTEV